jgi:hypothetical protein
VRREPDGDLHILLAGHPALVNSANVTYEHGDLVLEEICQGPVTQADAVAACQGVPQNLTVPSPGDRVRVTGSYVLDADHGWMEIHPVTRLTVIGQGQVPPAAAPAPVHHHHHTAPPPAPTGCTPKTSSGNCYEPGEYCPTADAGMTGVAGDGLWARPVADEWAERRRSSPEAVESAAFSSPRPAPYRPRRPARRDPQPAGRRSADKYSLETVALWPPSLGPPVRLPRPSIPPLCR